MSAAERDPAPGRLHVEIRNTTGRTAAVAAGIVVMTLGTALHGVSLWQIVFNHIILSAMMTNGFGIFLPITDGGYAHGHRSQS